MIAADTNHQATDSKTLSQSAAKIAEDLAVMAELHWRLFLDDARQYALEVVPLVETMVAAAVLLLAAIFMGLAAIALKLVSAGISPAGSFGLVALATVAVAAVLLMLIRRRFRRMAGGFVRSRTELARNVTWIKTKL